MEAKKRILIADDDEAIAAILSDMLTEEGYEVSTVGDGDEAIDILRRQAFDLVFVDIKMPKVDGFEVLKFIRENEGKERKVKVIMVTAFASTESAIKSLRLGADDFLAKPYDLDELVTATRIILSKS